MLDLMTHFLDLLDTKSNSISLYYNNRITDEYNFEPIVLFLGNSLFETLHARNYSHY